MPTGRMNPAAAVVKGKTYVIGGQLSAAASGAVEVYDPASDSWSTGTDMPTPRAHLMVVALGGKILAIGGAATPMSATATLEMCDPATDSWEAVADLPGKRTGFSAAVRDGAIYVIGGSEAPGGEGLASVASTTPAWIAGPKDPRWGFPTLPWPCARPERIGTRSEGCQGPGPLNRSTRWRSSLSSPEVSEGTRFSHREAESAVPGSEARPPRAFARGPQGKGLGFVGSARLFERRRQLAAESGMSGTTRPQIRGHRGTPERRPTTPWP